MQKNAAGLHRDLLFWLDEQQAPRAPDDIRDDRDEAY
jgi:hypothetical protein